MREIFDACTGSLLLKLPPTQRLRVGFDVEELPTLVLSCHEASPLRFHTYCRGDPCLTEAHGPPPSKHKWCAAGHSLSFVRYTAPTADGTLFVHTLRGAALHIPAAHHFVHRPHGAFHFYQTLAQDGAKYLVMASGAPPPNMTSLRMPDLGGGMYAGLQVLARPPFPPLLLLRGEERALVHVPPPSGFSASE